MMNTDVTGNIAVPKLNHKGNLCCELKFFFFMGFNIAKARNCDVRIQIVYKMLLFWSSVSVVSMPSVVVIATIISESAIVMIKANVNKNLFVNFRLNKNPKRKIQIEKVKNKKGVWTNVIDAKVKMIQRVEAKNIYVFVETRLVLNFEKKIWLINISKKEPNNAAIIFKFTTSYFLSICQMLVMLQPFF